MAEYVYIIGSDPPDEWASFERRKDNPRQIAAYKTCLQAVQAETEREPFIPGYLLGADECDRLSSLPLEVLVEKLKEIAIEETTGMGIDTRGMADHMLWVRNWKYDWYEKLSPEQLEKLLHLFDRRSDSTLIHPRYIHKIEVE